MSPKVFLSALILAGGKSSRMGRDKSLLPFGGKTMLEHMTQLTQGIFEETIVVVNHRAKTEGLDLSKAKVYEDLFKNGGPLAGIYTGLSYSKHSASCVFTCDMPFIDEVFIRNLLGFWRADMEALCFEDKQGRLQPFPGIYVRSSRFLVRTMLNQGESSMQHFLQVALVNPLVLKEEKLKVFINMNTLEDYYYVLTS